MTASGQFKPFEIVEGDRGNGLVLVADHAMRALPDEYGSLGLPPGEFERHIAYDIGIERVTRRLAHLLGVPAIMASFSRLLIDPNRGADDPTLVRQVYDGTIIPGNYPISEEELTRRRQDFYEPYHDAVSALIASAAAQSATAPLVIALHSFTPSMGGKMRPWHVGLLWDGDRRAVGHLFDALAADPSITVGDNEPYDGALPGDTMSRHCTANGIAHALIEIRQDMIAHDDAADDWADRLAPILDAVNARPDIHQTQVFPSRTAGK
jgi:predicted N-formylglutamate amidohydrolase